MKEYTYIFFSLYGSSFPIAKKISERREVITVQVKDIKELGNDDDKEDAEYAKKRRSLYDGVLTKEWATDFITRSKRFDGKDEWFVFFDSNALWKYAEEMLKQGFNVGHFPTHEDYELEEDREKAKQVVKANYPSLKVKPYSEFKKAQEGIDFLKASEKSYVLKSQGNIGKTIAPRFKEPGPNNSQLISALTENSKDYEQAGFILEEKIKGSEVTPEAIFWNGELVATTLDIESKYLMSGDSGPQVGCGTNLIVKTDSNARINKIAFPPYIYDEAKKHKGMFVIDASSYLSDGEFYFGEYCYNRVGWDAFPTELIMSGNEPELFFEKVAAGQNPFFYTYGTSVRLFNIGKKGTPIEAERQAWNPDTDPYIFSYDLLSKKGKTETTGMDIDLAVVCAASNESPEDAITQNYKHIEEFWYEGFSMRSQDDFLSDTYETSVMRRYQAIKPYLRTDVKRLFKTSARKRMPYKVDVPKRRLLT